MSSPPHEQAVFRGARGLPFMLLLLAGSGCAALIYEIVWFQMLQLVIGASAVSLAVLLGTFMGGMCLGSILLARLVSPERHPLRLWAWLETGIGLLALGVLFLLPHISKLYVAGVGPGLPGLLLRGAICGVCLLPPTVLMGATLPAVSRGVENTPRGVSWLGFFYASNIAGAVAGCVLAGFYLLRVHDMPTATYVAVALNGVVALCAFCLAAFAPPHSSVEPLAPASTLMPAVEPGRWRVYVSIALSGACALTAEVVWTRLLSLMLGATVYTFSIILAVFLVGLGLGSSAGSGVARVTTRPGKALGWCQLLLAGAVALAAYVLARSLPYWPINPTLARSPWFNFQLDVIRCAWAILPATCLWGASFPLALAAASPGARDHGRLVGRIYAANTLGAILGALTCSLLLIPSLGSQAVQRLMIGVSASAGLLMFAPSRRIRLGPGVLQAVRAALAVALGVALVRTVPKVPWELVAYGRYLPTRTDRGMNLYVGEGMNASVAVVELSDGVRNFHVSGKVEASTDTRDMRLQRMLGHLPALLHPGPRSVLVVGCGAGVTAGSFTRYPSVGQIVICEIEPLIPKVVAQYFDQENYGVLEDPHAKVVFDDARHYVLTSRDKFDIITSDPIHPWVKGAATLYTREYLETCKRHLNPGGLVSQWVPLYESDLAAVKSELATFFDVFPNGTVWSNDDAGSGYDLVLLGRAEGPMRIDVAEVLQRLNGSEHRRVLDSLHETGFKSAFALLATYAGQASDLGPWLSGAQINRDRNLRLQYLAGLELNQYLQESICSDMLFYRRFPKELFGGPEEWTEALRLAIERNKPGK